MTTADHRLIRDADGLNTASWPVPAEHFITPTDRFFTRSHAPVPRVDPGSWRLEVGGLVDRPRSFPLEELTGEFPRREIAATLACAGLRRDEFLSLGELPGELPWGPEPISTGSGAASLWATCSGRWAFHRVPGMWRWWVSTRSSARGAGSASVARLTSPRR